MALVNKDVIGFEEVMTNLNNQIEAIEGRTLKGLVLAAAFIRNETEKSRPFTPVDYGNLRASWFVVTSESKIEQGASPAFKNNEKTKQSAIKFATEHQDVLAESLATIKSNPDKMFVMMGYSANYALWVHENIGAENWSKEGSGPKWFETHVKRNTNTLIKIIKDNATIK